MMKKNVKKLTRITAIVKGGSRNCIPSSEDPSFVDFGNFLRFFHHPVGLSKLIFSIDLSKKKWI